MENQKAIVDEILSQIRRAVNIAEHYCEQGNMQLQLVVAIEEMSELIKEISKNMRGKSNKASLIEEIADVHIMLWQLLYIYNISESELIEEINKKLTRQEARIKGKYIQN